jgi:hypothetical protein
MTLEAAEAAHHAAHAAWRVAGDALEHAVRVAVARALRVGVADVCVRFAGVGDSGEVTLTWWVVGDYGAARSRVGTYLTGPDGGWYVCGLGNVDNLEVCLGG